MREENEAGFVPTGKIGAILLDAASGELVPRTGAVLGIMSSIAGASGWYEDGLGSPSHGVMGTLSAA